MANRFVAFCDRFSHHFRSRTHDSSVIAKHYLSGLMQANKKNMERMEEVVPNSDEQALQHFCSNSPWPERQVLDQVALEADEILGGHENSYLIVDEAGFSKKGDKSVGVSRQYNGRLGKVDNCQVGVFTALARDYKSTLIDTRLYLSEKWAENPSRCRDAGVPEDGIVYKKKVQLALEMITCSRKLGLRFAWVAADGLYGHDTEFTYALDNVDETFIVDVHKDHKIFLEDPKPIVPDPQPGKGCPPKNLQAQTVSIRIDKWAASQPESTWHVEELRESTKGTIKVEVLQRRVWVWDGKEKKARQWHLVIRRDYKPKTNPKRQRKINEELRPQADSKSQPMIESEPHTDVNPEFPLEAELTPEEEDKSVPESEQQTKPKSTMKYSLSNAPEDTSVHRLAFMQGQRYWIEQAIKEGKSNAGMADYQVRGWFGWHHHMALVMMAMLFMLRERDFLQPIKPLLSCSDIEGLLARFLPRRDVTVDEVIRQMEVRHRKRQASTDSAYRKQKKCAADSFP